MNTFTATLFVKYTDKNPLTYVLTSTKWDTMGHHWVVSLTNYNFILSYWSGKTNVDADALSHILRWEHDQHIETDSVHVLISQMAQGTTLIEAYSCNIQVTETLDIQKYAKVMSLEDWIMAQGQEPVIREIKYLSSKRKLKEYKVYYQDQQIMKQYPRQQGHLVICKGSYIGEWHCPRKIEMLYS